MHSVSIAPLREATSRSAGAKPKPQLEKLAYSVKEVCQATSLSRSTVYNLINSQALRAKRIGNRTIIPAESLAELLSLGEEA